jgi:hypothetical protein
VGRGDGDGEDCAVTHCVLQAPCIDGVQNRRTWVLQNVSSLLAMAMHLQPSVETQAVASSTLLHVGQHDLVLTNVYKPYCACRFMKGGDCSTDKNSASGPVSDTRCLHTICVTIVVVQAAAAALMISEDSGSSQNIGELPHTRLAAHLVGAADQARIAVIHVECTGMFLPYVAPGLHSCTATTITKQKPWYSTTRCRTL